MKKYKTNKIYINIILSDKWYFAEPKLLFMM